MKNYILCFLSLFLGISSFAQLSFQIANVSGDKNDTVSVPVTTTGFNNVLATQFSMSYDSNVLAIVDVVKTANFDVNYSTHVGSISVKNGQLGFTWDAPGGVGKNITNGSLLFTIRFKLIGKECDSSFVKLANKPTSIEVLDGNFDLLTLTANDGKVKINGPGCQGGPPPDTSGLQIIASTEMTPQGVVKCLKVTAKNFKDIQSGQFTMHWNTAVAVFDTINSGAMTLSWGQNYAALPDRSGVGINWDAGRDPANFADGVTLFEVCLRPVGAPGSMTDVTFDGTPVIVEFTNGNGDVVPVKFVSGKLTITDAPAKSLNLYYRDTTVKEGAEFCIPIRVDNFKCVQNFQFSVKFDQSKLKFKKITSIILPGLGPQNFNVVADSIRVTWDAQSGPQDLPNGGILFSICFESLLSAPNCPFTTKLLFTDLIGSPIEFSDCNSDNFNVIKDEPDITVECRMMSQPVSITLGARSNVKCNGECNGAVSGTQITGGVGPFDYEWMFQPNGPVISTKLETDELCAGSYKLVVIDKGNGNSRTESITITITEPELISCSAVVTHVQGVNDGAIDLTVLGGTPAYTFVWYRLPTKPNPPKTTEDIDKLPAAEYEVKITDANGCMKIDTFKVNPAPLRIVSISPLDSNKCNGDCNAKIFVSASGGKTPYSISWSNGDNGNTADSLCKGIYTVTVTDFDGNTATTNYTITEPDAIVITLDSIRKSSGSNGAIFIGTTKGGINPYTFQWKDSNGNVIGNMEDLNNIAPGTYILCITDKNLCVVCDTFVVESTNSTPPTLTVNLNFDPKIGGNAVTCRGKCDGVIIVDVQSTDPKLPYKFKWSHDPGNTTNTATGLCPGISYTVTVTDAANNTKVSNAFLLPDAPAIQLSVKRLACASTNTDSDGSYEAIISGATAPIAYTWCNGNNNVIAQDLAGGSCKLSIVDANGCQASENFTVCIGDQQEKDCYKGRLAISPNGDGFNDFLVINCVNNVDNVLVIYDRWGNQVYAANDYLNTWDGKDSDGNDLTEGTYMWILRVIEPGKNDQFYRNTVTIVR